MERDEWGFDIPPTEAGGGPGWQDAYGRGIKNSAVERRGPSYQFEDDLILKIDFQKAIVQLPTMQRIAVIKWMRDEELTGTEHNALHHAKRNLRKWLI